jgi:hypothetical protein
MNVGVMKDYKLRDLRASHTLGWLLQENKKRREPEKKTEKKNCKQ